MAASLTRGFVRLAERYQQPIAFENALNGGLYTPEGNQGIEDLMSSRFVRSITYLRQVDVVSPHNHFTRPSIRRMRDRHLKSLESPKPTDCPSDLTELAGDFSAR